MEKELKDEVNSIPLGYLESRVEDHLQFTARSMDTSLLCHSFHSSSQVAVGRWRSTSLSEIFFLNLNKCFSQIGFSSEDG